MQSHPYQPPESRESHERPETFVGGPRTRSPLLYALVVAGIVFILLVLTFLSTYEPRVN